jgi:leucyl/phenylalanyl-tRNA--protein transferase
MVDCQVRTDHLLSLGAREVPRAEFLDRLAVSLEKPTRRGAWRLPQATAREEAADAC